MLEFFKKQKIETGPSQSDMDRIFERNIYANLRFPQNFTAIAISTIDALLTSSNPRHMLAEYQKSKLPTAKLQEMLEHADKAHAAFLPSGKNLLLDYEDISSLWEQEKRTFSNILNYALNRREDSSTWSKNDIEQLRPVQDLTKVAMETIALPEVKELLKQYRLSFKDPARAETQKLKQQIREHIISAMDRKASTFGTRDLATANRFIRSVVERYAR